MLVFLLHCITPSPISPRPPHVTRRSHHGLNCPGLLLFTRSFGVLGTSFASCFLDSLHLRLPFSMALANPPSLSSCTHSSSIHSSRAPSWTTHDAQRPKEAPSLESGDAFHPIDLVSGLDNLHIEGIEPLASLDDIDINGLFSEKIPDTLDSAVPFPQIPTAAFNEPRQDVLDSPPSRKRGPFQRWMRTLHRRASQRPAILEAAEEGRQWEHVEAKEPSRGGLRYRLRHQKSSSGSSFGFVAAVQSASVSLASASAVTRSRRNTTRSHCQSRTDRSSRASLSAPRVSEDSMFIERCVPIDAAATQRALQRRQILEELVETEEGYIKDVRFLMNVSVSCLPRPINH